MKIFNRLKDLLTPHALLLQRIVQTTRKWSKTFILKNDQKRSGIYAIVSLWAQFFFCMLLNISSNENTRNSFLLTFFAFLLSEEARRWTFGKKWLWENTSFGKHEKTLEPTLLLSQHSCGIDVSFSYVVLLHLKTQWNNFIDIKFSSLSAPTKIEELTAGSDEKTQRSPAGNRHLVAEKELTAWWKSKSHTQFPLWLRSSVVRACD